MTGRPGDQLLSALDYLTTRSAVRDQIDADRLAVMGHSMGGGGALEAAKDDPALQADDDLRHDQAYVQLLAGSRWTATGAMGRSALSPPGHRPRD